MAIPLLPAASQPSESLPSSAARGLLNLGSPPGFVAKVSGPSNVLSWLWLARAATQVAFECEKSWEGDLFSPSDMPSQSSVTESAA